MGRLISFMSKSSAAGALVASLLAAWDFAKISDQDFRAGVLFLLDLIVFGVNK